MERNLLFGNVDQIGIEVGIDENGMLYEADNANVYEAEDTPENRRNFIKDAKRTLKEW